MRRQAKPFTVEVKKSKKAAGGPEPLFSPELLALGPDAPLRSDLPSPRLFSTHSEYRSSDAAHAFFREPEKPATRILPDLTVTVTPPVVVAERVALDEGTVPAKRPRAMRQPKPKFELADEAGAIEIELPVAMVFTKPSKRKMPTREERRARRQADTGLPMLRWERWKRRLPPVLR